jgi:hypothetical protein
VRSYEKLSSEGTSFAQTNLVEILERVLPAQFGGRLDDYQLIEEETPGGLLQLVLRVSPDVGAIDEAAVRASFLAELSRPGVGSASHAILLERAQAVVISRVRPTTSSLGKVLPFHVARITSSR